MGCKLVTRGLHFILALIASISCVWASDALILLKPEDAGPNVPAAMESHPTWVLWPTPLPAHTENGLLSLLSGEDWEGNAEALQFKSSGRSQWVSQGYKDLSQQGYLLTRQLFLRGRTTYLIPDRFGNSSEAALLLATSLGSPTVAADPWNEILSPESLVIFQAHSWDDAAFVSRKCGGKSLVVEFPPAEGARWSRYWLFGDRWPSSTVPSSPQLRFPGVIAARDLVKTLIDPASLNWQNGKTAPQPWLDRTERLSQLIRAVYLAAVLATLVFGTYLIKTETSFPLFRGWILLLLGLPAIDLFAGTICSWVGLSAWLIVVSTLCCCLLGGIAIANLIFRKWSDRHEVSLYFVAGVGLLACIGGNPMMSDYSPILLGNSQPTSFECLGFLGAYTVGVLAPIRFWSLRIGVTFFIEAAMLLKYSILVSFPEVAIGPLALIATLPVTWFSVLAMAILPIAGHGKIDHLCWTPFGLLGNRSDLTGFDVSELLLEIFSIPLAVSIAVGSVLGISTIGFAQHQLKASYRKSPICRPLSVLALYMICAAFIIPGMLAGALSVALGCALVLVYVATA